MSGPRVAVLAAQPIAVVDEALARLGFARVDARPAPADALVVIDSRLPDAVDIGRTASERAILVYFPEQAEVAVRELGGAFAEIVAASALVDEVAARLRVAASRASDSANRNRTLGYLAHDLNNPLAAIRILGEVLELDLADAEARRDVHDILEAVDGAAAMIESLSALARIERAFELHRAPIDLRDVARRASERACFQAHVDLTVPVEPCIVRGDAEALKQAISDVLWNAKRLTAEGRKVGLRVEARGIVCASSGIDVPSDAMSLLVEPFAATALREQKVPVAALGLAYADSVARRHGGRLVLEAAPQALTARIELPA